MVKKLKLKKIRLHPLTQLRIRRFVSIRRSFISFVIVAALILLSFAAELFINNRALMVYYKGKLHFPTYGRVRLGKEFGQDYGYETNYRELKEIFKETGEGWVFMPLVPYNAFEQHFKEDVYPPYAPSIKDKHFLGTDRIGRDVIARLVYGFRLGITFALVIVAINFFIGMVIGALMGYWGGWFDTFFQRIIEIWERIPFLYMVMIMASIFKPTLLMFIGIYVFFGWSARTWSVRAMTYRERERDYIMAAKTMGASTWRIIWVHIIPNVLVVIVTILPFAIAAAISSLAALDFLGLGLPPPTPSWGELLNQGIATYKTAPWILSSIITSMVLLLVMVAFIGEGLREAFDPKKYTIYR